MLEKSIDQLIERLCYYMNEGSTDNQPKYEWINVLDRLLTVFTWMKGKRNVLDESHLKDTCFKLEGRYKGWYSRINKYAISEDNCNEEDSNGRKIDAKYCRFLQSAMSRTKELLQLMQ